MTIKPQLKIEYGKTYGTLFFLLYSYKMNIQKTHEIKNNVNY